MCSGGWPAVFCISIILYLRVPAIKMNAKWSPFHLSQQLQGEGRGMFVLSEKNKKKVYILNAFFFPSWDEERISEKKLELNELSLYQFSNWTLFQPRTKQKCTNLQQKKGVAYSVLFFFLVTAYLRTLSPFLIV